MSDVSTESRIALAALDDEMGVVLRLGQRQAPPKLVELRACDGILHRSRALLP